MKTNDKQLDLKSKKEYLNTQFFDNRIVWLDSNEAAEYLRISVGNLRVKVSRGEIPVHGRLGRTWRFRREELDKLLETPTQGDYQ